MEQLLELFLSGGLRLPLFDPEFLALEWELPKSEVLALMLLQRRGECPMSQLAADLGAPLSTATGIGARLAKRGLAERNRDPADRRVILVRLTPAGQHLAERVRSQITGLFSRIQAVLTEAELSQLISLALKVVQAFQTPLDRVAPAEPKAGGRQIIIEDGED
ncbi:MAG TPA: MarR family transcriptional regulator [Symbiobacteriaceae bacterium]|jgi:DNA-binding MarR family transcriptional regulator